MAKYQTFEQYLKGQRIVRYIPTFKDCWDFATEAAEEKFNSAAQSGPTNTPQAAIALVRKLAEYYLTISSEYRTFNCFLETIEQRAAVR